MEKYQTFAPRFFASIIDSLVFLPLIFVNSMVFANTSPGVILYLWLLVLNLANPLYAILMHGYYGQTLGKMAFKVKVVTLLENPITIQHAVMRSLPQIIFSTAVLLASVSATAQNQETGYFTVSSVAGVITILLVFWFIADIITFFSVEHFRALHDVIAKTVVIKTNV